MGAWAVRVVASGAVRRSMSMCRGGRAIPIGRQIQMQSLDGDKVTFSLNGEGTFDWATKSISAVLRPRSSWLVLADVFGALQDRFYAVGVEGPVSDPEVELISFPDLQ